MRSMWSSCTRRVFAVCLWWAIYISAENSDSDGAEESTSTSINVPPPCDERSTCEGELCLCSARGVCSGYFNGQVSTADPTSSNTSKKVFAEALEHAYQDQLVLGFNLLALTTLPATDLGKVSRAWQELTEHKTIKSDDYFMMLKQHGRRPELHCPTDVYGAACNAYAEVRNQAKAGVSITDSDNADSDKGDSGFDEAKDFPLVGEGTVLATHELNPFSGTSWLWMLWQEVIDDASINLFLIRNPLDHYSAYVKQFPILPTGEKITFPFFFKKMWLPYARVLMKAQTSGAFSGHVEVLKILEKTLPPGELPKKIVERTKQYVGAARTSQQYILKYEELFANPLEVFSDLLDACGVGRELTLDLMDEVEMHKEENPKFEVAPNFAGFRPTGESFGAYGPVEVKQMLNMLKADGNITEVLDFFGYFYFANNNVGQSGLAKALTNNPFVDQEADLLKTRRYLAKAMGAYGIHGVEKADKAFRGDESLYKDWTRVLNYVAGLTPDFTEANRAPIFEVALVLLVAAGAATYARLNPDSAVTRAAGAVLGGARGALHSPLRSCQECWTRGKECVTGREFYMRSAIEQASPPDSPAAAPRAAPRAPTPGFTSKISNVAAQITSKLSSKAAPKPEANNPDEDIRTFYKNTRSKFRDGQRAKIDEFLNKASNKV